MEFSALDVNRQSNDRSDKCAQLEDGPVQVVIKTPIEELLSNTPENAKCLSFILLQRVTHHYGTLSRPQEGGGETKDTTSENEKPPSALGLIALKVKRF